MQLALARNLAFFSYESSHQSSVRVLTQKDIGRFFGVRSTFPSDIVATADSVEQSVDAPKKNLRAKIGIDAQAMQFSIGGKNSS